MTLEDFCEESPGDFAFGVHVNNAREKRPQVKRPFKPRSLGKEGRKDGIRPCSFSSTMSAALRTASCFAGRLQSVPLAQLIPHSVLRKPLRSKAPHLAAAGSQLDGLLHGSGFGSKARDRRRRRHGVGSGEIRPSPWRTGVGKELQVGS